MTDDDKCSKQYIDFRIEEYDKRMKILFAAQDKASALSSKILESKLEELNDVRHRFLPRTEYDIQHARVEDDIRMLRESKALLEGKASQSAVNISLSIAVIGILLSVVALLLH